MTSNIECIIEKSIVFSKYPVIFSGQDLSCLSGLPNFDELILGYPISEILNLDFFFEKSKEFYETS